MGEALISGAGGGTGKIYKWKRYEINSKTVYEWDKYSVLETTEYKWNKYDTTNRSYRAILVESRNSYGTIDKSWSSYTYNGSQFAVAGSVKEQTGSTIHSGRYAIQGGYLTGVSLSRYKTLYHSATGEPYGSYDTYWLTSSGRDGVYVDLPSNITSQGSTSYGQVTSTNSSAYPSNGASGSYWYVSAGSDTTYSKGSTSYGKVESESSSAYPNGGAQSGYWYENRNSRVDQSIGSYKDAVYSTARNTYPDNGIDGGYWYVFEEV